MGYASAKTAETGAIPIIDISALRGSGRQEERQEVARQLHRASRDVGFIYVSHHGIADADLASVRETALAFFRQPQERKEEVRVSSAHRGWLAQGGAKMQDDARADLKESFIFGHEEEDGSLLGDHALRGDNRWPAFMPELREAAMRYFRGAHDVAYQLMRGFALGLDLEEDFFLKSTARPLSRASFVYYPPQPEEMGSEQFGVGPHTDFGVLTVLAQDSVGGLQVQHANGDWIAAPPVPGTLVINVGDLLARWTNDEYRSTPHRVVNSSGRERLSLVLAYDPEPQTMIDAHDIDPDAEARYEPITCGDYLDWRFRKAFAYRNK
ncbi:MAG: 2-oxoglutarate and iron-dependent oxygenase domain-containing protein [Geminicoccaceae bacterium]